MTGIKHDDGKLPIHLVNPRAIEGIARVLAYGANEYGERNWEDGLNYSRCYSAVMRHMLAFWDGEENDDKSGLPHLDHAACGLMFLQSYNSWEWTDLDDRPV